MENYQGQGYPQQQYGQQYAQQYGQQYQNPYQQQYKQQQYPVYQQPVQPKDETKEVMSIGEYIGMFILSAIPVVNVICWIVWLCSSKTNKNKKNYIIASIILAAISVLLVVIASIIIAVTGVALLDSIYDFMW